MMNSSAYTKACGYGDPRSRNTKKEATLLPLPSFMPYGMGMKETWPTQFITNGKLSSTAATRKSKAVKLNW